MVTKPTIADFNHLILYAKGWYKRTDVIEDVRKIMARRCAVEIEYVSNNDVWQMCVNALMMYAKENDICRLLGGLFTKNFNESLMSEHDDICPLKRAIVLVLTVLVHLSLIDVRGNHILELGYPDPTILPLCDDDAMNRYKEIKEWCNSNPKL